MSRRVFAQATGLALSSTVLSRGVHANPIETPVMPSGVMSGDLTESSALIWSRCDRPATMMVEWSHRPDLSDARTQRGPLVQSDSDFTGKLILNHLSPREKIFYRVWFETTDGGMSPSAEGSFQMPGDSSDDVFFAWSGDTVGQGFGINPEFGGLKTYAAIDQVQPQFFVHCGDMIYADNPLVSELKLSDGTVWKNIVTPAKSKAAVSVDDFRGNFAYNLMDEHLRTFHSHVPQYVMWDDHEVCNNWYPQQVLAAQRDGKVYDGIRFASELAERAKQAFFEFTPIASDNTDRRIYRSIQRGPLLELFMLDMRSNRGPNSSNRQPELNAESAILGREQLQWLKHSLQKSTAMWKVICSDMPIGIIVGDSMEDKPYFEAVANGTPGAPSGRELEIAELLAWIKEAAITNTVWITADIHYAAAHFYDPARAARRNSFLPFWEFVAGPLHAGTFGPGQLDETFGPEVKFQWAPQEGCPAASPTERWHAILRYHSSRRSNQTHDGRTQRYVGQSAAQRFVRIRADVIIVR